MTFVDGQPVLTVNSRSGVSSSLPSSDLPTVKLSPQVRSEPINAAIAEIPLQRINTFLLDNRAMNVGELERSPRIIAGKNERFLLGKGDVAYTKGILDDNFNHYSIYKKGKEYIDPKTSKSSVYKPFV